MYTSTSLGKDLTSLIHKFKELIPLPLITIIYIYLAQTSLWIYSVALYNIVKVKLC